MINIPDRNNPPDIFDICVLVILSGSKDHYLTISEIHKQVGRLIEMTRSAVARRIDRLVEWGFATKKKEINIYYVKITDSGCKFLANLLLHIYERITLAHMIQYLLKKC